MGDEACTFCGGRGTVRLCCYCQLTSPGRCDYCRYDENERGSCRACKGTGKRSIQEAVDVLREEGL